MPASQTLFELVTAKTRIHTYTYRYERPSNYTRSPRCDLLALCSDLPSDSTGYYRTESSQSRVMPIGRLLIIPAGASISATGPGGDRRLSVCTMKEGFLPANFDFAEQRFLSMCSDVRDSNMWATMQRLSTEAANPGFASDVLVDGLSATLLVDVRRYFDAASMRMRQHTGTLAPWQLKRIREFVHTADGQRLRICDLAKIVGVSSGHLIRTFKRTTGQTVHEFVEGIRLERACAMLQTGRAPLKQIAATLGFASTSSFSMAFRRATGTTPGRFRREQSVLN